MAPVRHTISQRSGRSLVTIVAIALIAAACSSVSETAGPAPVDIAVSIPNEGGSNEGHTPIGFPGTGTGLFVGDNLNAGFPNGDGVQTYMTFALPSNATVDAAELRSGALETSGSPFTDLGDLLVERVEYTEFGPDLFDLPPSGDPTVCTVSGGTTVSCDVTKAVQAALDEGSTSVQFRLRFEQVADGDGEQDLAMFYRTDSNTNEKGIFTLALNGS